MNNLQKVLLVAINEIAGKEESEILFNIEGLSEKEANLILLEFALTQIKVSTELKNELKNIKTNPDETKIGIYFDISEKYKELNELPWIYTKYLHEKFLKE